MRQGKLTSLSSAACGNVLLMKYLNQLRRAPLMGPHSATCMPPTPFLLDSPTSSLGASAVLLSRDWGITCTALSETLGRPPSHRISSTGRCWVCSFPVNVVLSRRRKLARFLLSNRVSKKEKKASE